MSIINSQPLIGASGQSTGGYTIAKSLRFRSSASAYLNRTPGSAGNRKTWTYSVWVKRGSLSSAQDIFSAGTSGGVSTEFNLNFSSGNTLVIGSSSVLDAATTAVFRDSAAWYHIVLAVDTTQATASNRAKIWVNNVQYTFNADLYSTQNTDTPVNNTVTHNIGRRAINGVDLLDGYIAEVNFIDGQALTPSSFGETDSITGVWKPKAYSGSYGTNGFYLKFTDVATTSGSNAGLGKDFSGNGNYWNTNNISVTSGATYDSMTDVPTLTSATAANYCTWNPLQKGFYGSPTFSNGNLQTTAVACVSGATMAFPTSGKFYAEFVPTVADSVTIGICNQSPSRSLIIEYQRSGQKSINNSSSSYGSSYTTGDVIGVAVDCDANQITFYKNNTSQGAIAFSASGITSADMVFQAYTQSSTDAWTANFGQQPFAYTPPTGFKALNTYNLPDSTIVAGNKYMDATTYTGTGATRSVTNAGGFKPDFVWIKNRTGVYNHRLFDSIRGATKILYSNATDAELTDANSLTAFNSNGFSLGSAAGTNNNTDALVGWQWQAGQGSTSSNTSGSITSTVSVNASAGFSIVTYTGTGAAATIGHGLGIAPKMIICKARGATGNWVTYHTSIGAGNVLFLDLTDASSASTAAWNNTTPTSSVFSVAASANSNPSGVTAVAYCWSEIAGFSKFGSYTGNGSTDGSFVYTGFRPKFVLIKNTTTARNWDILDSSRNSYNVMNARLFPNAADAETTTTTPCDFVSNGFKIRTTDPSENTSGNTYIYAAFAEVPTKFANAR